MRQADMVVIGGGPAGLAAAVEACKCGLRDVIIIERDSEPGGILQQCIHNGFGLHIFGEELTGPEYAARFIEEVEKYNIELKLDTTVLNITRDREITAVNRCEGLVRLKAKAVVLAMGCRERTRGALNIPGSRPAGIFTAGTAQRFVNIEGYMPGKKIVILGSGDIGLIMARRMTLEGAEVKMVCELLPYPGGLTRNIVQCLDDFNIPLRLSHTVVKIHGKERIEGVMIARVDENRIPIPQTYEYVECDTLILSVGLIPENELSRQADINIDPKTSGAIVNESMETSAGGIFACGNVVHVHDLVDYVTEESRLAGRCAARYAAEGTDGVRSCHEKEGIEAVNTIPGRGIRYIVPHVIRREFIQPESKLLFRVDEPLRNVVIELISDGKIIHSIKRVKVAPGEMESIRLTEKMTEKICGRDLTIQIYCPPEGGNI